MIKKINFKQASRIILFLFGAILVYHVLILMQVIPYEMTWGGRLQTLDQMYRFESASIGLNIIFIVVTLAKSNQVARNKKSKVVNALLWLMVVLFSLNTAGNLASLNSMEAYIFTPVTFILAILCWRLAIE